ncbi:MAG: phage head closure protein [Gemmatimonadota bacterium]
MAIRAGDLRDRVTVQEETLTDDDRGGKTSGGWSAVSGMSRIPAQVKPLDGDERIAALQAQSGISHEVRMRYRTGITSAMRLLWHAYGADRTLYITSPPVVTGHAEGLRFLAREDAD